MYLIMIMYFFMHKHGECVYTPSPSQEKSVSGAISMNSQHVSNNVTPPHTSGLFQASFFLLSSRFIFLSVTISENNHLNVPSKGSG